MNEISKKDWPQDGHELVNCTQFRVVVSPTENISGQGTLYLDDDWMIVV
jgi:hypothetical protein